MNIVADENIPFAQQAFSALGEVTILPGRSLTHADLQQCECLLVRSVTRVDQALLEHTPVKFVASATIGTDHIDLDYLQQNDIGFANAPGCNAESASEYMINALFEICQKKGMDPFALTAGIVGHGNVGSRVRKKLEILGIDTLVNDPPLQDAGTDEYNYVSLQTILHECDFVTLHVPLTHTGRYPTYHMFDHDLLNELGRNTVLFNAARGAVIDNQALSELLDTRSDLTVYLDTWENEPEISQQLLKQVDLGTPHIAGYSFEGKLRGTQMILDAACDYFSLEADWSMQDYLPQKQFIDVTSLETHQFWPGLFRQNYSIEADHKCLQALAKLPAQQRAQEFDQLRKNYPMRYEYNQYCIKGVTDKKIASQLERLLFEVKN